MIDPGLVLNAIRTQLAAETGRPVGDNEAPDDRRLPYYIVRSIPGGATDGSMGEPNEDMVVPVQIDTVGALRDQASHWATKARIVLLGRTDGQWSTLLEGEDWRVFYREHDGDGGVEPEGTVQTNAERFRLHVTGR